MEARAPSGTEEDGWRLVLATRTVSTVYPTGRVVNLGPTPYERLGPVADAEAWFTKCSVTGPMASVDSEPSPTVSRGAITM